MIPRGQVAKEHSGSNGNAAHLYGSRADRALSFILFTRTKGIYLCLERYIRFVGKVYTYESKLI